MIKIVAACFLSILPAPASAGAWGALETSSLRSLAKAAPEITEFARVPLADLEKERPLAVKKVLLGGTAYSLTLVFDASKDTYVEMYPSGKPELAENWHIDKVLAGVVYEKAGGKINLIADEANLNFTGEDGQELAKVDITDFVTQVHSGARKIYFDWVPYALLRNTDPRNGEKSVVLLRLGLNGNYYTFAGYDMSLTHGWAQWFIPIKEKFYGMTMNGGDAVFLTKPFHIDTGDDETVPPAGSPAALGSY